MKKHVDHSRRILRLVPCFNGFANVAAAHHEKLDGSGYSLGLTAAELSTEARVLCVADIFDALSAKRPYRKQHLTLDEVFQIMSREAGTKLCRQAFEAMKYSIDHPEQAEPPAAPAKSTIPPISPSEEALLLSLERHGAQR